MKNRVTCIFDGICHLGECPIWNVERKKLFWTDTYNKRLWVYDPAINESRIFWQGEHQVGGFAFTKYGGMVLGSDLGIYLLPPEEMGKIHGKVIQLCTIYMLSNERFNDITIDPAGRIYAGTLRSDGQGGILYRIEKDKDPVTVLNNIGCSNGMTFSMGENYFFHTDTLARTITRYQYDKNTGQIVAPVIYFRGYSSQGMPDGITVDREDHIWAAFWGNGMVRRLNPKGEIVEEISIPALQPSSVMFGGDSLNDLYITTACQDAEDLKKGLDENGVFLGGPVYKVQTKCQGRPEWLADFN